MWEDEKVKDFPAFHSFAVFWKNANKAVRSLIFEF